jgi:ATP-dependent RNA helicase DDX24/MAK5
MKKKQQIRSKWESLPWKKVDLNQGSNDTEDDDKFLNSKNHYDNEKANPNDLFDISDKKGSQKDDYIDGADDPGIFLGLEVIDGSKYKVEKVAVADGFVTKLIIKDDDSSEHEKVDNDIESKSTEEQSNRNHQNDLKESISEEKDRYDGVDFSALSRQEKKKIKLNKLKEKRKEKALERKRQREEKETPDMEVNERKRTKKSKDQSKDSENKSCGAESSSLSQQEIDSIRNSWAMATSGLYLHPKICASLYRMGFHSPTPIQASTLAASILGKRDIVGAAPTGSGKTLGYLLPILHSLMTEEDENEEKGKTWPLTALVLCPTRELAMQVSSECNRLINLSQEGEAKSTIKCETIVGGLSEQKQKRVLDIKRPALLVCTPGRLWDLVSF